MSNKTLDPELRAKVWAKTSGRCWYCGHGLYTDSGFPQSFVVDHGAPRCRGGTDDLSNLRPSCWQCNSDKGIYRNYEQFREDTRAKLKAAAEVLLKYAGIKVKFDAKSWGFWGESNCSAPGRAAQIRKE